MLNIFESMFGGNINLPIGGTDVINVSPDQMKIAVASSTVFPTAKSMEDKEIKMASVRSVYKCSADKCHFGDALKCIQRSAGLNQKGVKETAEIVVNVIDQNQNLFTTHEVGGFVIQSMGIPFLFLENGTVTRSENTPVGFIDLTDVRRGLLYKHMLRTSAQEGVFSTILTSITTTGVMYAILKFSKKL